MEGQCVLFVTNRTRTEWQDPSGTFPADYDGQTGVVTREVEHGVEHFYESRVFVVTFKDGESVDAFENEIGDPEHITTPCLEGRHDSCIGHYYGRVEDGHAYIVCDCPHHMQQLRDEIR